MDRRTLLQSLAAAGVAILGLGMTGHRPGAAHAGRPPLKSRPRLTSATNSRKRS